MTGTLCLSACAPGMQAGVDSIRQAVQRGGTVDASPLDPNFTYLRVTRGSHTGLLWRGSIEGTSADPVEVFYSGTGEVLRLRDGRIVGAVGLTTEWRRVEVTGPAWASAAARQQSGPFVRLRDVMPGYRTGLRDELVLNVIPPPKRTALQAVYPAVLTWFEETAIQPKGGGWGLPAAETLPAARYAVDLRGGQASVVYSEQCLARDYCFTWQRWSAALQQAAAATPR